MVFIVFIVFLTKESKLFSPAALACQLDEFLVCFSPADPVGEYLPLGIEKGIPVFTSAVVEIAASLRQERMNQQSALSQISENHAGCDHLEVFPGLFFIPGRGPRRQRLQSHRGTPTVAGNTATVTVALRQEDGLDLGHEKLEIQGRCRWRP